MTESGYRNVIRSEDGGAARLQHVVIGGERDHNLRGVAPPCKGLIEIGKKLVRGRTIPGPEGPGVVERQLAFAPSGWR
jgi:hypothetical protein